MNATDLINKAINHYLNERITDTHMDLLRDVGKLRPYHSGIAEQHKSGFEEGHQQAVEEALILINNAIAKLMEELCDQQELKS